MCLENFNGCVTELQKSASNDFKQKIFSTYIFHEFANRPEPNVTMILAYLYVIKTI